MDTAAARFADHFHLRANPRSPPALARAGDPRHVCSCPTPAPTRGGSRCRQRRPTGPEAASLPAADDPALRHARRLLRSTILIDGHNDLPIAIRGYRPAPMDIVAYDLRRRTPGDTDIPRLRAGLVGGQFWSVYIAGEGPGPYARVQLEQIDLARRIIDRYPDTFRLALSAADIRAAHRAGRIASMLGMEGGYGLENSLGPLRAYYDLGVRYMTLTHNTHTDWADSAAQVPMRHGGLTPFGEEVVREMNRLGMLVDLAHTAPGTMDDALRVSEAPVIFSHAAARGLCDISRNVPDDILRQRAAQRRRRDGDLRRRLDRLRGGERHAAGDDRTRDGAARRAGQDARGARAGCSRKAWPRSRCPPTTIGKVADHIEYVRDLAGIDHVGIGGDFDGNSWWPQGLSDVSMYPNLFAELVRRGWSDATCASSRARTCCVRWPTPSRWRSGCRAARPASILRSSARRDAARRAGARCPAPAHTPCGSPRTDRAPAGASAASRAPRRAMAGSARNALAAHPHWGRGIASMSSSAPIMRAR